MATRNKGNVSHQPVCRDPLGFSIAPRGKHRRVIHVPAVGWWLMQPNGKIVDRVPIDLMTEADAVLWVAEGLLP